MLMGFAAIIHCACEVRRIVWSCVILAATVCMTLTDAEAK